MSSLIRHQSLDVRRMKAYELTKNQAGVVPIIVEVYPSKSQPEVVERRMSMTNTSTLFSVAMIIRKSIDLKPEKTLNYYCGFTLINLAETIGRLHDRYKNQEDGILYIQCRVQESGG